MSFAPPTLVELGAFLNAQGVVNLGIVGDASHVAKGVSYHLGRDQLATGAYSARTPRDRQGLTNAASAIDLGKVSGSLDHLRALSRWLVDQAQRNAPGTVDLREIIYSPDGQRVLRWDRERGFESAPLAGEADDSHLTHTHLSFYRDAEFRDHRTAFRTYPWESAMPELVIEFRAPIAFTADDQVNGAASWAAAPPHALQPRVKGTFKVDATVFIPDGTPHGRFVRVVTGTTGRRIVAVTDVTPATAAPAPDCDQAVADARADVRARAIAAAEAL